MSHNQKSFLITLLGCSVLGTLAFLGGCSQEQCVYACVVGLLLGFFFTFED